MTLKTGKTLSQVSRLTMGLRDETQPTAIWQGYYLKMSRTSSAGGRNTLARDQND
jgi:hypothetical protein